MGIIIGLSGQARVGKDTFADYIVKNHRFVKVGLADPMKRFCKEVFDFTDEQLYGNERDESDIRYLQKSEWKIGPEGVPVKKDTYLTPRYALQTLGTEWGRNCYDDVWIEYGIRVAKELLHGYSTYSAQEGLVETEKDTGICPGVVFSDIRFKNEFDAIKKAGGKMVRIYRNGYGGNVGIQGHASEKEQQGIPDSDFDMVLANHEGLEDYYKTVDWAMKHLTGGTPG